MSQKPKEQPVVSQCLRAVLLPVVTFRCSHENWALSVSPGKSDVLSSLLHLFSLTRTSCSCACITFLFFCSQMKNVEMRNTAGSIRVPHSSAHSNPKCVQGILVRVASSPCPLHGLVCNEGKLRRAKLVLQYVACCILYTILSLSLSLFPAAKEASSSHRRTVCYFLLPLCLSSSRFNYPVHLLFSFPLNIVSFASVQEKQDKPNSFSQVKLRF